MAGVGRRGKVCALLSARIWHLGVLCLFFLNRVCGSGERVLERCSVMLGSAIRRSWRRRLAVQMIGSDR